VNGLINFALFCNNITFLQVLLIFCVWHVIFLASARVFNYVNVNLKRRMSDGSR
jgi:hypothetical protein